jgi:hypothetical protein
MESRMELETLATCLSATQRPLVAVLAWRNLDMGVIRWRSKRTCAYRKPCLSPIRASHSQLSLKDSRISQGRGHWDDELTRFQWLQKIIASSNTLP